MTVLSAGLANLALGIVYVVIGTMIALDLEQDMRRRGFSHFGVSWLTIMFSCGAHHLVHGVHLAGEGRSIGVLDLVTVGIGLPAGAIFSWLRIQARRGGAGDRLIGGTPLWLRGLASAYVLITVAVLGLAAGLIGRGTATGDPRLLPNVLLTVLYIGVGAGLWRGQARNREAFGGWSMSGLSLMMIFPTCALMHAVYVVYASTGSFAPDYHGLWVDWLGVPAAMYFLWVVQGLERGTLRDWNERFEEIRDLAASAVPDDPSALMSDAQA